ncbi:MAG: sulfur carrier protein ThiS [Planctomycetota bacterium]
MSDNIQIQLNGKQKSVRASFSISELLVELEIAHPAVAVEINQQIQPRNEFASTKLKDGDVVEVVSLVGGG